MLGHADSWSCSVSQRLRAGLVPLSLLSGDVRLSSRSCKLGNKHKAEAQAALQGSAVQRISDVGLGVAIPLHSHMAMNSVITDYVPKGPFQSAYALPASGDLPF